MSKDPVIDALVAEHVMGWHLACGVWIGQNGLSTEYSREEDGQDFSPSTNIAAAWEVVEQCENILGCAEFNMSHCDDGSWTANFGGDSQREYGETPALAICLAALKAKGIEVPE